MSCFQRVSARDRQIDQTQRNYGSSATDRNSRTSAQLLLEFGEQRGGQITVANRVEVGIGSPVGLGVIIAQDSEVAVFGDERPVRLLVFGAGSERIIFQRTTLLTLLLTVPLKRTYLGRCGNWL